VTVSVQESPFDCRDARALCRAQPTLASAGVTLRRLRRADAPSLLAHLTREPVRRYTGAAPSSVSALTRFIAWTRAERCRGLRLCYGIVVPDEPWAVGLIEMWSIDRDFSTAEWGFVLSDLYWGSGVFQGSAALLAAFAFQELGVFRLEARVVETNGRANGALQKLGATCEGVLRGGFRDGTTIRHQRMWSILASEWSADRSRIREHR
jgi:ribosomal-protein-alanine N-acetyltransferase